MAIEQAKLQFNDATEKAKAMIPALEKVVEQKRSELLVVTTQLNAIKLLASMHERV